jgi:hypothetical protein
LTFITPDLSHAFEQRAKLRAVRRARCTRDPFEDGRTLDLCESEAQSLIAGSGLIVAVREV